MPNHQKYVQGILFDEAFGEHLKADQKFTADTMRLFLERALFYVHMAILDKNVDAKTLLSLER